MATWMGDLKRVVQTFNVQKRHEGARDCVTVDSNFTTKFLATLIFNMFVPFHCDKFSTFYDLNSAHFFMAPRDLCTL